MSTESQPPADASPRPPLRIAPEPPAEPKPPPAAEEEQMRDDVAHLRDAAAQAQARAALRAGIADRIPGPVPVTYVGIVSRGIGFTIDAAIINLVALVVAAATALITSVFPLPHGVKVAIAAVGGVVYVLWVIGFFVAFWSGTGQTPGARVMDFRVVTSNKERLPARRALVRCGGVVLAALPLFLGFVPIIFDDRRRSLADYIARTLVVEAPSVPIAPRQRRLRDRGAN